MKVTRRDLLVWSAGAAAGLLATPVPWKILDDTSIWSQNWPWIPQPARGPVEVKQSFCTLCPKGCGLRVRMAAGWAVGVAGSEYASYQPGGALPAGIRGTSTELASATTAKRSPWLRQIHPHGSRREAAFAKASKEGPVVSHRWLSGPRCILGAGDLRREAGWQLSRGSHVRTSGSDPYESWTGIPAALLGYDLENARTIVSFGAPLLDGWGTPGRFTRLWAERAAGMSDPQLRLIQIDSSLSRTAARAWQWVEIREGSESALASGLAGALLEQNLVPAHSPVPSMTLARIGGPDGRQHRAHSRTRTHDGRENTSARRCTR